MTDPNIPPSDGVASDRVVHQTTINTAPPQRKGGGALAFIVGGLIVAVAVIGWVLYSDGRPMAPPERPEVNLDINVPAPKLPEAPRLPDVPRPAEPPTVTAPTPEPAT
ncbi:MAG: hypothetical protein P0Y52_07210 [Candidatus Brevundimonas phytovorans]|nr:hypothetical protein [Brevundimonas sp.]WEK59321.1 MAG: hypothetical protein P0Y52_07210 [Brevundimonas sp.]